MNVFQAVENVVGYMPAIISAVQAVESVVPGGGNGAAKLDAVKTILQTGYNVAEGVTKDFEAVWPSIQPAIDAVVKLFNSAGIFHHKDQAAASIAPTPAPATEAPAAPAV